METNIATLAKAELELSELIKRKKQLDRVGGGTNTQDLVNLEANLYALETTYLEETAGFGKKYRSANLM